MAVTRYKSPKAPPGSKYLYRYDYRDQTGRRFRVGGFKTRDDAQDALSRRRTDDHQIAHGLEPTLRKPRVTIAALVEARIEQVGTTTRDTRHRAVILRTWLRMIDETLPVTRLSEAHLRVFVERERAAVAPSTVFRKLTIICACLRQAPVLFPDDLKQWTPPARPAVYSTTGARVTRRVTRQRVISLDEARALLAHLRRPREASHIRFKREPVTRYHARLDAADYFQIALQTGARASEIRRLRWTDFSAEWRTLRRVIMKTGGESFVAPIPASLVAALEVRRARLLAEGRESVWMFPNTRDVSRVLFKFENGALRRAAKELNIVWGRYQDGGFVLHDARHTAVTQMLDSGIDIPTVQAITGHHAATILLRYGHSTARSRRQAIETLDRFSEVEEVADSEKVSKNRPRIAGNAAIAEDA